MSRVVLGGGLSASCLAAALAVAACAGNESTAGGGGSGQGTGGACPSDVPSPVFDCQPLDAGQGCPWPPTNDAGPSYPEGCVLTYYGRPEPGGMCTPSLPDGGLQCGFPTWEDPCTCYCSCNCQQLPNGLAFACGI